MRCGRTNQKSLPEPFDHATSRSCVRELPNAGRSIVEQMLRVPRSGNNTRHLRGSQYVFQKELAPTSAIEVGCPRGQLPSAGLAE